MLDAVETYASGTCDRFVRCGIWTDDVSSCEAAAVGYFCTNWDCSAPVSERELEDLEGCVGRYRGLTCSTVAPVCMF